MKFRLPLILLVAFLVASVPLSLAQRPDPEVHGTFEGDPMYTLLEPNAIPAIDDPEYVTGAVAAAQMAAEETVMGVATGTDAVCWSTWQLDRHEIVNDRLDDTPIAATW